MYGSVDNFLLIWSLVYEIFVRTGFSTHSLVAAGCVSGLITFGE